MSIRPIDAIFVHPKQRFYVVYYRGELWRLPRMKIDDVSWQNRQRYKGDGSELYLSRHQTISDPILAKKLHTLDLPAALHGRNLSRFESWWETHGFDWLKEQVIADQLPLTASQTTEQTKAIDNQTASPSNYPPSEANENDHISQKDDERVSTLTAQKDIFAEMLSNLTTEVLHQPL
ncbi:hypothetical protein AAJP47_08060 [Psychrobacter sp. B38]|uniref:hypothetical protein n=1 Tax=Psychrobacter sp. B38 TaxID=3143538 RepID=UPI00320F7100